MCSEIALLRVQMCAAVLGAAGLIWKDVEHDLLCTLAQTLLLHTFGYTGPQKVLLILLRPQMCAAHLEGEEE
jgi:hypothetical protein